MTDVLKPLVRNPAEILRSMAQYAQRHGTPAEVEPADILAVLAELDELKKANTATVLAWLGAFGDSNRPALILKPRGSEQWIILDRIKSMRRAGVISSPNTERDGALTFDIELAAESQTR